MNKKFHCLAGFLGVALVSSSVQAGIVIGGTRVIYPGDKREVSLQVDNPDKVAYLVQSWVEGESKEKAPFVITPPLLRSEPKEKITLRIVRMGGKLAEARESLYWLNIKAIPPNTAADGTNTLQIAVKSRLKLIYRPAALQEKTPEDVTASLKWERSGNMLRVSNPTAYYMNFHLVTVGGKEVKDVTYVAPSSTLSMPLPAGASGTSVTWRLITDFGGIGSEHKANF
ncbi:fimbrial biogenesis chaperone [Enterobacter asburiae]|uniref:fimbrial biogenesis chaperone n=1 Tax=Enterobacter asburiae TaxID=61645 RepID=UPI00192B2C82|nr:molecular chaperone [Enterobacter asburiae]MBL5841314.1 molecular chaperone [Enterobacter asburiae]MBL5941707.1 molecular chaperone [Enterobacter asburiae]MBL5972110.1 molecular chaperone [Enterobacter asburiae]